MRQHVPVQRVETVGRDGAIDRAPPDVALAGGFLDDELVVGRAAGVGAGVGHQRAALGQRAFVAAQRFLDQLFGGVVPVFRVDVADAVLVKPWTLTAGPISA
jgi:hypothetical protein